MGPIIANHEVFAGRDSNLPVFEKVSAAVGADITGNIILPEELVVDIDVAVFNRNYFVG